MPDVSLPVDLRSDTVTKPTRQMRAAMADAEVGDDVLGDDPTVIALQEKAAQLLGKQAALFVPSGTMANQIAIAAHTHPGDEIISDISSHVYYYEAGAFAALSGCSIKFCHGDRGIFTPDMVAASVRPDDSHFPRSRLVIIENTHNRGGGTIWPLERIAEIRRVADRHDLILHTDGARLMNASIASGIPPADFVQHCESVSICFSKGLGAPVGSIVAGCSDFIRQAHRLRKRFGGGMRQVGILAAAAQYALDHHLNRLADDHDHAKLLAAGLADIRGIDVDPATVQTNIVLFDLDESVGPADAFCDRLHAAGVWMFPFGPQRLRAVTHLDVSRDQIVAAIDIIRQCAADAAK